MASVLYVDDEPAIGRAVSLWLTRRGHRVQVANTAASARLMLAAARFDAVFIDLWLGADSGLELYRWIDELDADLARRVAFVTGDAFDAALNDGSIARPVLLKPFELTALEGHVRACSDLPAVPASRRGP